MRSLLASYSDRCSLERRGGPRTSHQLLLFGSENGEEDITTSQWKMDREFSVVEERISISEALLPREWQMDSKRQ